MTDDFVYLFLFVCCFFLFENLFTLKSYQGLDLVIKT